MHLSTNFPLLKRGKVMTNINYQKKLSTVKICGKVRAKDIPEGGELDLYEVVGVASGVKSGTTDFGDWQALTGTFAAQNLETGEQFRSGVCFLPDVGLDPILGQLGAGANAVEFGWVVGIQEDDDVVCGYSYYVRPLIAADENDPLKELTAKMTVRALEDQSTGENDPEPKPTPKKGGKSKAK